MAPTNASDNIYSATYSNVPVFEFNVEGNHVMRRRHDDWINATHILKVADYDKPQRTRILEREVQKGVHEKVQGGYGKYQGTWIPLQDGRVLAQRNNVLHKLQPLFDYVPGDISPPQAPKHATNKPKIPRAMAVAKKQKTKFRPNASQMSDDPYENISTQLNDDESVENSSMISGSFVQEDDYHGPYPGVSRKRKRAPEAVMVDQHHQLYGDSLLDYFVLSSESPVGLEAGMPPTPPPGYQVDRAIDDQQHTAIHWAAAMADIPVVRLFLDLSADIGARNIRGETPLIRAVIFTNNYEKHTMGQLVDLLKDSICIHDKFSGTVLHHIAATTQSHSRKKVARYYFDVLLNKLSQMLPPPEFASFLNARDLKGDTALHIVARNHARKCIRTLLGRGAAGDIPNNDGETADQLIHLGRLQRHDEYALASSSPIQRGASLTNGYDTTNRIDPSLTMQTQSPKYTTVAARSFSDSFGPLISGKGLQIALALDSEVQDKDADLAEAQRLLSSVDNERHLVRQRTFALMTGMDVGEDEQELEDLQHEHADLQAVAQSFLEQSQHRELHQEIRAAESQLPRSAHQHHAEINGTTPQELVLAEKSTAARHLATEQDQRRQLVESVVRAQATAGMSKKGEGCKELIAQLTGLVREDVGGLVPELLEELEMSKMEGLSGADGLLPKMAIATF